MEIGSKNICRTVMAYGGTPGIETKILVSTISSLTFIQNIDFWEWILYESRNWGSWESKSYWQQFLFSVRNSLQNQDIIWM